MSTLQNRLAEAVLMSTHNLCFEQKYENYQSFLSDFFQFLEVKFSIYLKRLFLVLTLRKGVNKSRQITSQRKSKVSSSLFPNKVITMFDRFYKNNNTAKNWTNMNQRTNGPIPHLRPPVLDLDRESMDDRILRR